MKNKIIMISGKQGSGKTTIGFEVQKLLVDQGHEVHQLSFATTIYKIHNYAISLLESLGIKRDIAKDGPLLQLLGTEWGRKTISEDIWVECLKGEIQDKSRVNPHKEKVFIITDCRFKNELAGIPEALTVRLECPTEIRKKRCSMWRDRDNHPSETDLDDSLSDFDMIIDTNEYNAAECARAIMLYLEKRG